MDLVRSINDLEASNVRVDIFDLHEVDVNYQKLAMFEVIYNNDTILSSVFSLPHCQSPDDDESAAAILYSLSLRPGEDPEGPQDDDYTQEQEDFVKMYGEMFTEYADDLMGVS